jgi:pilus assembly protein CpaB
VLTRGNRAITVPISATSGNAGFVFPGDLVDVILTAKYSDTPDKNDNGNFYAATLLESVRVLAIDQKTEYNKGDAAVGKTATLEVTPKQAEIIALSLQMGQLQLSLRSLNGQEDNNLASRPAGESTSVANAEATVGEGEKPKRDQERSYVLDKELRFMLDGHAPASREITILRGGEEKKAAY